LSYQIFAKEFREEHWIKYYHMSKKYMDALPDSIRIILDNMNMEEDIKTVALYRLKGNARKWFNSQLPLLDGIMPLELLSSEEGTKALKEILLRMPG
jgi:hypothetical protein